MEDFQKIVDKFNKDPNKAYFSLFDGHGGTEVVEFAKERIYTLFHNHFNETSDVKKSLIYSFEECDKEIQKMAKNNNLKMSNMGSTGTVIFITKENDLLLGIKKVIYCANVGDTRCVLISNSGCKRLSHDHNCNDDNEINRIKKKGGNIINDRVQGKLSLTRALGDFSLKNNGLISTLSILKIKY
jgi:serine/threonine protein phosphatase PrpC